MSETLGQLLNRLHSGMVSFDQLASWYYERGIEKDTLNSEIAALTRTLREASEGHKRLKEENDDLLFRIKTLDACYQKALKDIVKSSQSLAAAEKRLEKVREWKLANGGLRTEYIDWEELDELLGGGK